MFCETEDFEFEFVGFGLIGIEGAAIPVSEMIVLWMLWIGHGIEELVVAREAPDVFGRAFTGDLD